MNLHKRLLVLGACEEGLQGVWHGPLQRVEKKLIREWTREALVKDALMVVAAVQTEPRFARPQENWGMIRRYCRLAARRQAGLVVFPELCVTGYNFASRKTLEPLAEPVPDGPTTQLWLELAQSHDMVIVGGLAELGTDGQLYNSAVAVGPDGFLGCYRKLHLFSRERDLFASGSQPPPVFRLPNVAIGVMVCFDWAFPEVARILMLEGCEVLCHPANLVLPFAQRVMVARSIENRIFTITANRVGVERDLAFLGRSQITDCSGDILVQGPCNRPSVLIAEINPREARNKQLTPTNNILADRRVTAYRRLLQS
jgi:predicted amidohydrolase